MFFFSYFSCIAEEVFGNCQNSEECFKKAFFLRICAAELAAHLASRPEYYDIIEESAFNELDASNYNGDFREHTTYASVIHMRLLATLINTSIRVFVKSWGQSGQWITYFPLFGTPDDNKMIYLILEGAADDGHFKVIRDIKIQVC